MRKSSGTPRQRKQAIEHSHSSRSEQKYSQETRLTASDTLGPDSSEDETSDKTNKSKHCDIDETLETHQHS